MRFLVEALGFGCMFFGGMGFFAATQSHGRFWHTFSEAAFILALGAVIVWAGVHVFL